ncbi:hypothetical protein BRARA_J00822 [Brassica rapa]|uniref:Uncharacterized protein n=1 Tax=Brassica campestris TaxID=3711 RepID=A0A397XRC1_BRACM|nr:hypothetical protein BRARA_J00822 [Brassica rapa]
MTVNFVNSTMMIRFRQQWSDSDKQRFHSAKKMIHSDQHESPTTLHCQNSCYLLERG